MILSIITDFDVCAPVLACYSHGLRKYLLLSIVLILITEAGPSMGITRTVGSRKYLLTIVLISIFVV